ncbi:MAG: hypothetical protein Q9204_005219 [Flavoplaca sp. TL-2023a]
MADGQDIFDDVFLIPPRPPSPCTEITARNSTLSRLLMLPDEIRLDIYLRCLVSSLPIVVWSAQEKSLSDDSIPLKSPRLIRNPEARASDICRVLISLLRSCRSLAADAACIFYSENTFVFSGRHRYYRIIAWLDAIGQRNRDNLSALEISVRRPPKAWQLPDGTRLKARVQDVQDFSPRHPHFSGPSPISPEGEVDVINPAIETIISFFARPGGVPKIKLVLQLSYGTVPGMEFIDLGFQNGTLFTMDLPNVIEKWRADYTFGSMEVLWRGELPEKLLTRDEGEIKGLGWEILDEENIQRPWFLHFRPRPDPNRTMPSSRQFLLKRKELTGLLVAATTSPMSAKGRGAYTH